MINPNSHCKASITAKIYFTVFGQYFSVEVIALKAFRYTQKKRLMIIHNIKVPSPDRVLERMKDLSCPVRLFDTPRGKKDMNLALMID